MIRNVIKYFGLILIAICASCSEEDEPLDYSSLGSIRDGRYENRQITVYKDGIKQNNNITDFFQCSDPIDPTAQYDIKYITNIEVKGLFGKREKIRIHGESDWDRFIGETSYKGKHYDVRIEYVSKLFTCKLEDALIEIYLTTRE